jgi:putative ABC transport system substrate-binding protein
MTQSGNDGLNAATVGRNRREFIAMLGGIVTGWSSSARAQQPAMPVIGYLSSDSFDLDADRLRAFRQGLGEVGFVDGRNVAIEYRGTEGQYDRLPAFAADLVRRRVAVIVADSGVPGARAAKAATTTIPIVFTTGVDPVAFGLVASLAKPGGNLTGVTSLSDEIGPKRLELLHEVVPSATVVALLVNPTNANSGPQASAMQEGARKLGLRLHILHASSESEFVTAFATAVQLQVGGLMIGPDTFWRSARRSEQLAALATRHAIPAIGIQRDFAGAGGLMSYGGGTGSVHRISGVYAGRILKGEKAADLPVQQATKIEFVINAKTAKALGLTVPLPVLAFADEVIE